jgi:multiple antibiotic resistance protein
VTLTATVVNILLAVGVFLSGGLIHRILGVTGTKIVSKLANLLLAAIAVMMIRKGVLFFVGVAAGAAP